MRSLRGGRCCGDRGHVPNKAPIPSDIFPLYRGPERGKASDAVAFHLVAAEGNWIEKLFAFSASEQISCAAPSPFPWIPRSCCCLRRGCNSVPLLWGGHVGLARFTATRSGRGSGRPPFRARLAPLRVPLRLRRRGSRTQRDGSCTERCRSPAVERSTILRKLCAMHARSPLRTVQVSLTNYRPR